MGNQYALLSTPIADNGVYLRHRAGIPRVKGGQIFSCSNYFHALPKLLFLIGTTRTALMRMKLYRWCRQIFCLLVSVQV
jgi:hypothetical protein